MKTLLILLLISLSFAQFADPPIDSVSGNNTQTALGLDGYYNNSIASNDSLNIVFGNYSQPLSLSESTDMAGMSVMMDNFTSPLPNLSLILVRGYRQGHLLSLPSQGFANFRCDRGYYLNQDNQNSRCDFDNDGCIDYENQSYAEYDYNVTFNIFNATDSANSSSNLVLVPPDILSAMENSSGNDSLYVNLSGEVLFVYQIDHQFKSQGSCMDNFTTITKGIPVSLNQSFLVAGTHRLFFLKSPVLREQWYIDNRFDTIVLSQSPLYRAEIYLDGNLSKNISLRSFYILNNAYGLEEIHSNQTAPSDWSENSSNITTPIPLEGDNQSFRYVYEFNYSYQGLGPNNLTLAVNDSFQHSDTFQDTFTSRMLSYNGMTTENGTPIETVPSRPSVAFTEGQLAQLQIGLGLVAFVVVLAFVNFWVLR